MGKIKIGDVVFLKSNPEFKMTVEKVVDKEATCSWINNGKPESKNYNINLLEKYINNKKEIKNNYKIKKSYKKFSSSTIILCILVFILLLAVIIFIPFSFNKIQSCQDNLKNAYDVFKDLTTILITIFTIFFTIMIAIGGVILKKILLDDVKTEIVTINENWLYECKCEIQRKFAYIFDELYYQAEELKKDKKEIYLNLALKYSKLSMSNAEKLPEKEYRQKMDSLNNYLMTLALKGDKNDTKEAYKNTLILEKLIEKNYNKLDFIEDIQYYEETIQFARARLPRENSKDKENAILDFKIKLSTSPEYESWETRWKFFELF